MRRGGNVFTAVVALVVAVLLAVVAVSTWTLRQDFDERGVEVQALREQLLDAGVKPKVGPPGDAGTSGDRGEKGDPGGAGERGPVGMDGIDGITPACWFTTAQCVGLTGFNGRDSTVPGPQGPGGADSTVPGPAGADGQDSTVPGPQGPPGADSTVPGPQGESGSPGADSTVPGPQGPPGPRPDSFSFEWANQTYTCTDPDGDGAYSCEQGAVTQDPTP